MNSFNSHDPRYIFLYGSGRSGTTWLEERISSALSAEVIFEPLNPEAGLLAKEYAYCYLSEDEVARELIEFLDALLTGNSATLWTRYRILPARLLPNCSTFLVKAEFKAWVKRFLETIKRISQYYPSRRYENKVIKFIRANLLFPWLIENFPSVVHIFIVRHPASVVESRMRLDKQAQQAGIIQGANDWSALKHIKHYENCSKLPIDIEKVLHDLHPIGQLSEYECQCVLWCVENKLILEETSKQPIVFFYEDLIVEDSPAWEKLASAIGVDKKALTGTMDLASQQASLGFSSDDENWKALSLERLLMLVGDDCLERLQDFLDLFMISQYSASTLSPNPDSRDRFNNGA